MITFDFFNKVFLFEKCTPLQFGTLSRFFIRKSFFKNRPVYVEGDSAEGIYIIKSGEVELNLDVNEDKTTTICNLREADYFGIGEIFFDAYYLNAVCTENSELYFIDKSIFFEKFLPIPEINKKVLTDFARIVRIASTQDNRNTSTNSILLFLISLCKRNGQLIEGNYCANLHYTHEEIAHILNITREHVSRVFLKLKKENIIRIEDGMIIIEKEKSETVIKGMEMLDHMKF